MAKILYSLYKITEDPNIIHLCLYNFMIVKRWDEN